MDDDAPPGYVKNKPGVKKRKKKKTKIKFRNLMYAALVRDSNLKMKIRFGCGGELLLSYSHTSALRCSLSKQIVPLLRLLLLLLLTHPPIFFSIT